MEVGWALETIISTVMTPRILQSTNGGEVVNYCPRVFVM
jgi:hypothetical protein